MDAENECVIQDFGQPVFRDRPALQTTRSTNRAFQAMVKFQSVPSTPEYSKVAKILSMNRGV